MNPDNMEEQKTREKEGGDPTQWMLSFIDLLSLLTSFFVLLYSMSAVKDADFKKISQSLNKALNHTKPEGSVVVEDAFTASKFNIPYAVGLDYLYSVIYKKLNELEIASKVRLTRYQDRIVISLSGNDTFLPGGIKLSGRAGDIIPLIADMLSSLSNQVEVVAGPDENLISARDSYSSDWELALARALMVSDMIKEKGYYGHINSFARAGRISDAEGGKSDFIRRVDIVIEDKAAKNF